MQEYIYEPKKIYYRTNDFQDGRPTLVFVHGLSGSSSAWAEYEKFFKDDCNILTYDIRGHGKTKKPMRMEEYAIGNFGDDLYELLNFLKIEKIILIGHSFGTLICFDFISKYQQMVDKVIFLSPNPAPGETLAAKIFKPLFLITKFFGFLPFSSKGASHIDYDHYRGTGDWNIRRMFADIKNTSLRVWLYCGRQSYEVEFLSLLKKIRIPTLIIHGKKDTIFPYSGAVTMSELIDDSHLITMDKSDHIIVLNNFPELSQEIERFIDTDS